MESSFGLRKNKLFLFPLRTEIDCKVISLQLIKINEKKKKRTATEHSSELSYISFIFLFWYKFIFLLSFFLIHGIVSVQIGSTAFNKRPYETD